MSNNPTAIQSQKWIVEALLELMASKEYHLISVSELSAKAQIDRRTFYRHFACKDDILRLLINEISTEYLNALQANSLTDTYTITKIFFDVCLQHSEFFILLSKSNLMYYLLEKFYANLPIIHSQVRSNEIESLLGQDMDYFLFFHAGGFWSILSKWITDGMEKSSNDLAILASTITSRLI